MIFLKNEASKTFDRKCENYVYSSVIIANLNKFCQESLESNHFK